MNKDDKIKELELEIARLKGVVEGMRTANPYYLYPPIQPVIRPYPYTPYWYSSTTTNVPCATSSSTSTTATTGYLAQATGIN